MTDVDLIRKNDNLMCGITIIGVLLGVIVLIGLANVFFQIGLANVFFQIGRTSAISEIRNSGYTVTYVCEYTNSHYIVEKKVK